MTADSTSRPEVNGLNVPPLLVVDLDGTLLRGDLLWEGLGALLRAAPLWLLAVPIWLARGRPALKQRLCDHVVLEPASLPYRQSVLDYIAQARVAGREVGLASASPDRWVRAVADELGGFDFALGSDAQTNLKGAAKLEVIEEHAAGRGFEYVGDSKADLPIWRAAAQATLVFSKPALERELGHDERVHHLGIKDSGEWLEALREMRPVQWIKNGLVFAPLALAHEWTDPSKAVATILTFLAFCVVASAGYILNDLLDIQSDRNHAIKKFRPLASGALPIPGACLLLAGLACFFCIFAAFLLSSAVSAMLVLYLALSLAYSFYFKEKLLVDAIVLAGLYSHRILTGGVATGVPISPWLLVFSGSLFLSLAFVKRFAELGSLPSSGQQTVERRAYRAEDLGIVEIIGVSCAAVSVLVLCLFVSSPDVTQLYSVPVLLWMMVPIMFYWVSRIWMLARRGEIKGDPVLFASRDTSSYFCGALLLLVVALAARL